jgi:hypothetical protein
MPVATRAEPALSCGNCRAPMRRLDLAGHYGRRVELDLCAGCHLVWFDLTESARLGGPGLLALIEQMAAAQRLPHEPLRPDAGCARCQGGLKTIHNRTRWGESLQLECRARHGVYQSFAQFLQEKGLLRPMSHLDRAQLLARAGRIDCVNCGAAVAAADERCAYCGSVASLLDVARLARALDPEGALALQPVHVLRAEQAALQCAACGAALLPGQALSCPQCGATLAISRLDEAIDRVEVLAPALQQHARQPAPEIVKRRLAALDADLPRRREWVQEMEAETQRQRDRFDGGGEWRALFSRQPHPWRAVLLALVIWFVWWFWPRR